MTIGGNDSGGPLDGGWEGIEFLGVHGASGTVTAANSNSRKKKGKGMIA